MFISDNIYIVIVICVVVFLSAVIIIYNTRMLVIDVQEFTNCTSGMCLKTGKAVPPAPGALTSPEPENSYLYKFHDFHDIKEKHPLKLYGCIKVPCSQDLLEEVAKICYVSYQEFYSGSLYNVYEKIADDVNRTKMKVQEELVHDPIYAIIYQEEDCGDDERKFTKIIMMYPMYKSVESELASEQIQLSKNSLTKCSNFLNKYVDKTKCKGTVYVLNKHHNLFNDVIQKREKAIL